MFELFEHTADLGLRVIAADADTLFAEAAQALFSAIVDDLDSVHPVIAVEIEIAGGDRDYLLFDWLRELLRRHDQERLLFSRFAVRIGPTGLKATAGGEAIDPARHTLLHEVKAITYHELKVVPHAAGLLAEVIVDI